MSWFTTGDVARFLAEAGEFLRAGRVRNTVILTVAENLRVKGQLLTGGQPAQDEPLFGWWRPGADGNQVRGAFLHTPAFPVFLTFMSQRAAAELAGDLAATGRLIQGVNANPTPRKRSRRRWPTTPGPQRRFTAACGCSCSVNSSGRIRRPRVRPGRPPNGTGAC